MKRIGELLLEARLINQEQLDMALELQAAMGKPKRLGEILVENGFLGLDTLIQFLDLQIQERERELQG